MNKKSPRRPRQGIVVAGAGITGLWQALLLAKAGHHVRLVEREAQTQPFAGAASRYAGAMLAPDCEAESAPVIVRDQGRRALAQWRMVYPGLKMAGSLVVAPPRDRGELVRFARATQNHQTLDAAALAHLEPALADRFESALYFPGEGHMVVPSALAFLLDAVQNAGVDVTFGCDYAAGEWSKRATKILVDCRGLAAQPNVPQLRGVRGERVIVRARDVHLNRPVRYLHPRIPLYIVPWDDGYFMIGATVIESAEAGPASVRSAIELLSAACSVHPGFAEAEIIEIGAGVRPALPDNVPRVFARADGKAYRVNGAYRHGFLLAPVLACAVVDAIEGIVGNYPLVVKVP